jgi:hypothetical protein
MRRFLVGAIIFALAATLAPSALAAKHRKGKVLLVGTYHGIKGQYKTIQAAVKAAKPYDVILVAPGDYKTKRSSSPKGTGGDFPAGVLISKPDIILRGMDRNTVIVDGTKKGPACNDIPADQNYGPKAKGGPAGLNGVEVWKADDVTVQNLTACNFLGGAGGDGGTGNEIWWNGGAESGSIGGWGYTGSYLTATSTWFNPNTKLAQKVREETAAQYGIFTSNWNGGTLDQTYASNMNDSGYYIGACQQECNQVIDHAWAEYSALGYSGSNSGGSLVVENSQFDNNEDGFDTNSQNGDNPPPQDGECPGKQKSPITHTRSCWVFIHNYVHDNNDPNVPAAGAAAAGPVGTGMTISGGRYDTVMDNTFKHNNAWGVALVPYPDSGGPCTGGQPNNPLLGSGSCLYDEYGDSLIDNKFIDDGSYGHPTNGAFAQLNFLDNEPGDCYSGNTGNGGGPLNSYAAGLQAAYATCDFNSKVPNDLSTQATFLLEVLCDTGVQISGLPQCPNGPYPQMTKINNGLHKLPPAKKLETMRNPCAGIPKNAWCTKKK